MAPTSSSFNFYSAILACRAVHKELKSPDASWTTYLHYFGKGYELRVAHAPVGEKDFSKHSIYFFREKAISHAEPLRKVDPNKILKILLEQVSKNFNESSLLAIN